MKIPHSKITNWITAIATLILAIVGFIALQKNEEPVSIQTEIKTESGFGVGVNNGEINIHNQPAFEPTTDVTKPIPSNIPPEQAITGTSKHNESKVNDISCIIPNKCRHSINIPTVYSDPPKENICWRVEGVENEIDNSKFGAIIKNGNANIVQRCEDKIYSIYRWVPSNNILSSDKLNEHYSQDGYRFKKISDTIWKYEKKWRTK